MHCCNLDPWGWEVLEHGSFISRKGMWDQGFIDMAHWSWSMWLASAVCRSSCVFSHSGGLTPSWVLSWCEDWEARRAFFQAVTSMTKCMTPDHEIASMTFASRRSPSNNDLPTWSWMAKDVLRDWLLIQLRPHGLCQSEKYRLVNQLTYNFTTWKPGNKWYFFRCVIHYVVFVARDAWPLLRLFCYLIFFVTFVAKSLDIFQVKFSTLGLPTYWTLGNIGTLTLWRSNIWYHDLTAFNHSFQWESESLRFHIWKVCDGRSRRLQNIGIICSVSIWDSGQQLFSNSFFGVLVNDHDSSGLGEGDGITLLDPVWICGGRQSVENDTIHWSTQITTTSHDVTPKGGLVKEIHDFPGWWINYSNLPNR